MYEKSVENLFSTYFSTKSLLGFGVSSPNITPQTYKFKIDWGTVPVRGCRTSVRICTHLCRCKPELVPVVKNHPADNFWDWLLPVIGSWNPFLLQEGAQMCKALLPTSSNAPDDKSVPPSAEGGQRRCLWTPPPFRKGGRKAQFHSIEAFYTN